VFVTHDDGDSYIGGGFDVTIYAKRNDGPTGRRCSENESRDGCHASHRRFYAQFEVFDGLSAENPSLFSYGLGFSSSFEWYPARRGLIPFYAAEAGGVVQDGRGHLLQTCPALGLHLWAGDRLWLSASAAYRVVPAALYDLSGPTFALRAMVNPW
jgi:hypothetical protein